jgi:DNA-binding PadR family transcriptional regulator
MSISEFSRFSDPALLILASLAGGPKHGYAMMGEIQEMVGVHLGPGTLYGALLRLERFGLIEAQPSEATRRRPYRLTGLGATSFCIQPLGVPAMQRNFQLCSKNV